MFRPTKGEDNGARSRICTTSGDCSLLSVELLLFFVVQHTATKNRAFSVRPTRAGKEMAYCNGPFSYSALCTVEESSPKQLLDKVCWPLLSSSSQRRISIS